MSLSPDDYHRLLGFEVDHFPPSYYQILGIPEFEDSQDRIQSAVLSLDSRLRSVIQGPDVASAQELLNDIAKAKICLTNELTKCQYDESLKANSYDGKTGEQSFPGFDSLEDFPQEVSTRRVGSIEINTGMKPDDHVEIINNGSSCEDKKTIRKYGRVSARTTKQWIWLSAAIVVFFFIATFTTVLWIKSMNIVVEKESRHSESTPANSQQNRTKVGAGVVESNVTTEKRQSSEPSARNVRNVGEVGTAGIANDAKYIADLDVLPNSDGLVFWLDANDEKTLEMDDQRTVYCWTEKVSGHRSTSRLNFPKRTQTELGKWALEFDGRVGFFFNSLTGFSPEEFTIIYIANGSGILMAKGDAHLEPEASFSIDSKNEMRFRTASRKYLAVSGSSSDQFIPRAILISSSDIRLIEHGGKTAKRDWKLRLRNPHPLSIGMLASEDSRRSKINLFQGTIGEILIFDRALDGEDARSLMDYLFTKWLESR